MYELMYSLLFVAILLALGVLNGIRTENKRQAIGEPFQAKWANHLYRYSYYIPFIWFIDEGESDKKTKDIKQKLVDANLRGFFNYRSYMTLRVGLLILSGVLYLGILFLLTNGEMVLKIFFNIKANTMSDANSYRDTKIAIGMALLILNALPNLYLKRRADLNRYYYVRDIPIVQLFIILMLRSKKPISDVLYALSKINTRYRSIYEIGYRKFLRNKEDGFDYIKEGFEATNFKDTITVLKEMGNYSREDSIRLLENNMQQMVEKNNSQKRRKDLSQLVYSQGTIAIPFLAIIVLGLIPIAVYGATFLQQAGLSF